MNTVVLASDVQESDSVIHVHLSIFFFKFFSPSAYCRILSHVPCAIQETLVGYLFKYGSSVCVLTASLSCLPLALRAACCCILPCCDCAFSPPWALQLFPLFPRQLWHLCNSVLLLHCLTFTTVFHSSNLKCSHYSLCFIPKLDLHPLLNLFPNGGSTVWLGLAYDTAVVKF